ncbi:MAG: hypothetical protein K1X44_01270 [Alphaproteobacteria bacterium]|nr:hypothetical protein [Alphaproteobacteria bacterium]
MFYSFNRKYNLLALFLAFHFFVLSFFSFHTYAEDIAIEAYPLHPMVQPPILNNQIILKFLGGLELRSPNENFGGYSGLAIPDDNHQQILAISDFGKWLSFSPIYNNQQVLKSLIP